MLNSQGGRSNLPSPALPEPKEEGEQRLEKKGGGGMANYPKEGLTACIDNLSELQRELGLRVPAIRP